MLIALLVGLEAATPAALEACAARLRAMSASWSATISKTAERRFFDGWVARDERPAPRLPPPLAPPSPFAARRAATDIIGLFPQPEARR